MAVQVHVAYSKSIMGVGVVAGGLFPWYLNQIDISHHNKNTNLAINLKEYYEIVDEARPLSEFVPTLADFFTEMQFCNHETC